MSEFPDQTRLQLQNEVLRRSAEAWRLTFESQRRASYWMSIPGLICGAGVFTLDAPLWVSAAAGATIAGSVGTLAYAAAGWKQSRHEARVDQALMQRLLDQDDEDRNRWYPE
jgi:uncharacterized membrane protein